MASGLTALLLTHNEEANLARTLTALTALTPVLERLVLVDSGSTDQTLNLAREHRPKGVALTLLQRPFDSFARQWNHGLAHVESPWVLCLDADYVIPAALAAELRHAIAMAPADLAGFALGFRYCVGGRPLAGALLPSRVALFRPDCGRYRDDGHTQRLQLSGRVERLQQRIHHDDRKPLERWLGAQLRYLREERDKLRSRCWAELSHADRLRKHTPLAPLAVGLLCLLGRGNLWEGRRGLFYAAQRVYAELLLLLLLLEPVG
ncbi:MAG: glycosyltransferase family 2 protein [Cyanobacteriota bacterium]|nr:glycosyltransferase family 2 protein [Cyanobacteriota bacterium]